MKTTTDSTQQLTLLPSVSVPPQFRLSEETRRRGRLHIAELRAQMAARQVAEETNVRRLPARPTRDDNDHFSAA